MPGAVCTAGREAGTAQVPRRRAVPRPSGKEQPHGGSGANACGPWREAPVRGRRGQGAAKATLHSTRLQKPTQRERPPGARPTQREAVPPGRRTP